VPITVLAQPLEAIVANVTHVKVAHITTLRAVTNAARAYYGIAPRVWKHVIISGRTNAAYFPLHILELRSAVEDVIDFIDTWSGVGEESPFTWEDIGSGRPRAAVVAQLQIVSAEL
jgi:hypothetical protein